MDAELRLQSVVVQLQLFTQAPFSLGLNAVYINYQKAIYIALNPIKIKL
jgi:hypothetical protein